MLIVALSLLAGILSVLAPCVLPFLPVIVGGSVSAGRRSRPYLIAAGLVVSLLAFTLLLKVTTTFINVDPRFWTIVSGSLVIFLGLTMLLPGIWSRIATALRLSSGSHKLLDATQHRQGWAWPLLTGAALGPVFSSCSPTYAWIIATVLPARKGEAFLYLTAYCIGMAATLLAVSLLGRWAVQKLGWAANPSGWFQRGLSILFILVGVLVATGTADKIQAWAVDKYPGLASLEQALLPQGENAPQVHADVHPEAPEIQGISHWINTAPTTIAAQHGKVVLVDFWTYSCINCIRTQPYLNAWYDRYHDEGFEIIGVHAPEFAFERVPANVERAVQDAGIRYPVALDNDFATWNAYGNRYWPAKYLIDQQGRVVWTHFGEGAYDEAEAKIRELLGENGAKAATAQDAETATHGQSPETYLGLDRARGYVGTPLRLGENTTTAAGRLNTNEWTLGGAWQVDGERITAAADGATLTYRFAGTQMFLVMDAAQAARVQVHVEGVADPGGSDVDAGAVTVDGARLYRLVKLPQATGGTTVTLTFPQGVSANAFTFG